MDIKIGAHTSIAGGYSKALDRIADMGLNAMQIFSSSPRSWTLPDPTLDQIESFLVKQKELKISPVYFHATYLINMASCGKLAEISKQALIKDFEIASILGVKGVVIHLGSLNAVGNSYENLMDNISDVLHAVPSDVKFIIENSGTKKIGTTMEEIFKIVSDLGSTQVGVCLDTCHLYAAGYNLSNQNQFETFFKTFDKQIGLDKLELFHVNDSKDPFASNRDRHENIGQGKVSIDVFRNLFKNPLTKHKPFILEVPGFADKGPDAENVRILKELVQNA